MTYLELADFIEDFLSGAKNQGPYEWEDFTIFKSKQTNIEKVRRQIIEIACNHPDESNQMWCSKDGLQELSRLAKSLRNGKFEALSD